MSERGDAGSNEAAATRRRPSVGLEIALVAGGAVIGLALGVSETAHEASSNLLAGILIAPVALTVLTLKGVLGGGAAALLVAVRRALPARAATAMAWWIACPLALAAVFFWLRSSLAPPPPPPPPPALVLHAALAKPDPHCPGSPLQALPYAPGMAPLVYDPRSHLAWGVLMLESADLDSSDAYCRSIGMRLPTRAELTTLAGTGEEDLQALECAWQRGGAAPFIAVGGDLVNLGRGNPSPIPRLVCTLSVGP